MSPSFHLLPDPVVVCGPDGCCVLVNPAARRELGLDAGTPLADGPLAPAWSEASMGAPRGEVALADGRVLDWRRLEVDGAVGLAFRDVTRSARLLAEARLAREQAEETSRAKDEFLATVSHELRTPLTAILGWAHLLRSGRLDEATAHRAIDTIERNATLQTRLISDILDVSRIVTGKMRLTVRPVEIARVVEAAVDSARPQADARGVALDTDLTGDLGRVAGDAGRLQQVVTNLLTNAIKFTPPGGRVAVRGCLTEDAVCVEVVDDGEGIAPDFLPHVFERFRQQGPRGTRGGLGLGLAIVRHLVELHGGSVEAASEGPGRGATFTVRLPPMERVMAGTAALAGAPPLALEEEARVLEGLTVLVVEDEADARELLRTVLATRGARVVAVDSAADALRALDEHRPDVLLSDIEMPGEDGYALIRRVRARGADAGGRLPAAAITAYARSEDRLQALLAGFQIHVPKPVNPEELTMVVASLAGRLRNPA